MLKAHGEVAGRSTVDVIEIPAFEKVDTEAIGTVHDAQVTGRLRSPWL
jgi:hypothetical protein